MPFSGILTVILPPLLSYWSSSLLTDPPPFTHAPLLTAMCIKQELLSSIMVWIWNFPHRLMLLNIWLCWQWLGNLKHGPWLTEVGPWKQNSEHYSPTLCLVSFSASWSHDYSRSSATSLPQGPTELLLLALPTPWWTETANQNITVLQSWHHSVAVIENIDQQRVGEWMNIFHLTSFIEGSPEETQAGIWSKRYGGKNCLLAPSLTHV